MKSFIHRVIGARINAVSLVAPEKAARMAFNLFCEPPKPHLRPKELEFLQSAKQEKLETNTLHYIKYSWGSIDSEAYVLLAYGWAYNAGRWRHFVPQLLEAGVRVIAFDPPGHGLCPGNHLNMYLNAQIIRHIIESEGKPQGIIAHSFGGSSSILALEELDKSLHPEAFALMASFSASHPVFVDFAATLGLRASVLRDMISYTESLIKRPLSDFDLAIKTANLAHIQALVIHDPADAITPFFHAERYHRYWPNSILKRVAGAGHHLGKQEITDMVVQHVLLKNEVLSC